MADPLQASGVFPAMVCQMIAVGESTGALDAMLEKIADFYDEEVDQAVENLTAMIEPMMIVFLGVVVGGLEYHFHHIGKRRSWRIFTWTLGIEVALIIVNLLFVGLFNTAF